MPPPLSLLGGDIPTTSNLMARYAAVLDACALVPIVLADTLLRIAELGLYRPLWSARIFAETIDAISEIHPTIPLEQIQRRFADMDAT